MLGKNPAEKLLKLASNNPLSSHLRNVTLFGNLENF